MLLLLMLDASSSQAFLCGGVCVLRVCLEGFLCKDRYPLLYVGPAAGLGRYRLLLCGRVSRRPFFVASTHLESRTAPDTDVCVRQPAATLQCGCLQSTYLLAAFVLLSHKGPLWSDCAQCCCCYYCWC